MYDVKYKGEEVRDVKVEGGGIVFMSKVPKKGDGGGCFTAESEVSSLPQGVAAIATVTLGGKSRRHWATKEEALRAFGIKEE